MAFRIRVVTPSVVDEDGDPHAAGEFTFGHARLFFRVDLRRWGVANYEAQWKSAVERLVRGAAATAMLTSYRGPGDVTHIGWALWREDNWVYAQKQSFCPVELTEPFDPWNPDVHVGLRLPVTEEQLPIQEWRADSVHLFAAAFGVRLPHLPP